MTPCGFDNLKFHPLSDLKADDDSGEGDSGPDNLKRGEVKNSNRDTFFANANIKKINWDVCLANAKPEERDKYCIEKFEKVSQEAIEYCSVNFLLISVQLLPNVLRGNH